MGQAAYSEKTYLDSKGRKHFYRFWKAKRAKATLVILHALGLHSGRYAWFCEELASRGVSCFALDFYGHGLSEGAGKSVSFSELIASARTFVHLVRSKCDSCELHLAGHGTGALVALAVSSSLSCKVLALSPLVELAPYWRSPLQLNLMSILRMRVRLNLHPLYDSKHRDALLEVEEDNLIVRKIPAKLVADALRFLRASQRFDVNLVILTETMLLSSECYSAFKKASGRIEAEIVFNPDWQDFPFDELVERFIARRQGASEP